ncbi:MAG TPA: response regulator [Thermoplasmata archaeon]|nr:response regulator [Thermoplasmata archaeon]
MVQAIRILLVEDNPGDARLVELALPEEDGRSYPVEKVDRISSALKRLQRPGIDLILLDRWLPDSEGWTGLDQIQAKAPRLPVIVLTGSVEPRLAREALERGAQDYLMKGIFPQGVLGERVRSAIARHRVAEALAQANGPDAPLKRELDRLVDGVAVFEADRVVYANPALTALGEGPRGAEPGLPKGFPVGLLRSSSGPAASGGVTGPPRRIVGDLILEGGKGGSVDVEYRIETWWPPEGPRTLLWARDVSSDDASASRRPVRSPRVRPRPPANVPVESKGPPDRGRSGRAALDPDGWRRLVELSGRSPTFLPELIETFLGEGRSLVADLSHASSTGDTESLRQAAHRFSSTSRQIGAVRLGELCSRLERSNQGPLLGDETPSLLAEIPREFELAREELARKRQTLS